MLNDEDTRKFYNSKEWRKLRKKVLRDDKCECLYHKQKGEYVKATHVHHINYVRKHPELALEKIYRDDDGNIKRNLVSVCKGCHETVCHPERLRWNVKEPLTQERWD